MILAAASSAFVPRPHRPLDRALPSPSSAPSSVLSLAARAYELAARGLASALLFEAHEHPGEGEAAARFALFAIAAAASSLAPPVALEIAGTAGEALGRALAGADRPQARTIAALAAAEVSTRDPWRAAAGVAELAGARLATGAGRWERQAEEVFLRSGIRSMEGPEAPDDLDRLIATCADGHAVEHRLAPAALAAAAAFLRHRQDASAPTLRGWAGRLRIAAERTMDSRGSALLALAAWLQLLAGETSAFADDLTLAMLLTPADDPAAATWLPLVAAAAPDPGHRRSLLAHLATDALWPAAWPAFWSNAGYLSAAAHLAAGLAVTEPSGLALPALRALALYVAVELRDRAERPAHRGSAPPPPLGQ